MKPHEWMGDNNRAVAILRVSSSGQKNGSSPETQLTEATDYCVGLNLNLVKSTKVVESAKASSDRDKYHAAIRDALKQGIRHIVFFMYDRESRNLTDNEQNEILVRQDKIVLHYSNEGKILHKNSPDSDFFVRDINAAANKNFSRVLSAKVRAAMRTKAEGGYFPRNHPPLGYMNQKLKDENGVELKRKTAMVPNTKEPRKIAQVQREYELRGLQKLSYAAIREQIISEGFIALEKIGSYGISQVESRLKNKFYRGYFDWEEIEYKGKHELIIPAHILRAVDASFGKRYKARTETAIFGNEWLKCSCGCSVVYDPKVKTNKTTGQAKTYHYYHCTNGKRAHESLKGMAVAEEVIWKKFGEVVEGITISSELAQRIAEGLNETKEKAIEVTRREMASFKEAQRELERKEDALYQDYHAGVIDKEFFKRNQERIRADRSRYEDLLENRSVAIASAGFDTAQSILELAMSAKTLWENRSVVERRAMLDTILSNPVLDAPTIRYDLKKPFLVLMKIQKNKEVRAHRDSNPGPSD